MDFDSQAMDRYRVEVSGWDRAENFFVEKTTLDWDREGKKDIALRADVREGAVIFVRLLQSAADVNNIPIAFQAVKVASKDNSGRTHLCLEQMRPRADLPGSNSAGPSKEPETVRVA
jgi:hypothetical protein